MSHSHDVHNMQAAGTTTDYPKMNYGAGNKWIKHLTQGRLGTFNGGHYADANLASVLYTHRIDDSSYVKLQVWSAPGLEKPMFEEAIKQKFRSAKKGDSFGPSWVRPVLATRSPKANKHGIDKPLVEGFSYNPSLLGAV